MADVIARGNSMDGSIRVFAAVTTDLVNEAQRIHHTYPVATAALGRTLTIAAIMGAGMKNESDTATIQFKGDGPLGSIVAVTDSKSLVRGYVANPYVDLPLNAQGKLDVGRGVGHGVLNVIQDLGLKEPYIGQVPIVSGEIAEDMTYYFAVSEQIPTAIGLGVLVDTDNTAVCAGGFMIQLMPEAAPETAARIEEHLKTMEPVTALLQKGMHAEELLFHVTEGFDMLMENQTVTPAYRCKCSRERMERALISIGKKELEEMIEEQGQAELTCQFCDKKYQFNKEELLALYRQAQ
ncbi:MAG TPA: Hsp33 family molecular chaperone HslO [Candidatus Avimonoglobus intestinipullorum]|uniref:33 kDa chaperonin n=1 Tax=Candidatus Avimonoglobus intestinipullorum TaxID=2840699 RepID=A0A9D1LUZ0_9FIRM|nr:Hsp33 family molecular chaperone HslO [Candidatus Avimonoglobus intestinipullorum]